MSINTEFGEIFAGAKIMAILRGMGPKRSLSVAQRAWHLGITCVEVPIQTTDDVESLKVVADVAEREGYRVGAGTVATPDHVRQAHEAGAAFTVSPGLDLDVVSMSHDLGMPSLPGVATATEVQRALGAGLVWLKAFPASLLTGAWFKAMQGPFPEAKFVATGGMDSHNALDFLNVGVEVVAVGSALEDDAQLPGLAEVVG